MRPFVLPLLSIFALGLAGCAHSGSISSPAVEDISENLADSKTPVLSSAYLEKEWGKPNITVKTDGTYRLRYRLGTTLNFVVISSLTRLEPAPEKAPDWKEPHDDPEGTTPEPPPHKQSWKETKILGSKVKWYQADGGSGADFPAYQTVDFSLVAPDGRTGFYQIMVCSDKESKAAAWINRVNW